jgi:hypothetical protein
MARNSVTLNQYATFSWDSAKSGRASAPQAFTTPSLYDTMLGI